MLTDEQLAAAKALVEAATPGPWGWLSNDLSRFRYDTLRAGSGDSRFRVLDIVDADVLRRDAAFIAASRTLVPELIAEIERLRAEKAELCERIDYLAACAGEGDE